MPALRWFAHQLSLFFLFSVVWGVPTNVTIPWTDTETLQYNPPTWSSRTDWTLRGVDGMAYSVQEGCSISFNFTGTAVYVYFNGYNSSITLDGSPTKWTDASSQLPQAVRETFPPNNSEDVLVPWVYYSATFLSADRHFVTLRNDMIATPNDTAFLLFKLVQFTADLPESSSINPSSTSSSPPPTSSPSSTGPPVATIAGSVVGGVAFLAIVGVGIFFFVRRRGKQPPVAPIAPVPYTGTITSGPGSSRPNQPQMQYTHRRPSTTASTPYTTTTFSHHATPPPLPSSSPHHTIPTTATFSHNQTPPLPTSSPPVSSNTHYTGRSSSRTPASHSSPRPPSPAMTTTTAWHDRILMGEAPRYSQVPATTPLDPSGRIPWRATETPAPRYTES